MKNPLIYLFIAAFAASCSLSKPAPSAEFVQASKFHERIAILPFSVEFNDDYKRMIAQRGGRNATQPGYWAKTGKFAGLDMQQNAFKNMAKQIKKGKYEIVIQDFITTNKRLDEAGISYEGLSVVNKGLLAKQLDVDAVIYGESFVNIDFRGINPGGVSTQLNVFDARTGQLVWQDEL
ncbi:MAG: hypothetical protein NWP83_00155, partial [Spirosomaceae bacterium]|nr:hypothetical protein [Spirosomataceae bacterium]